MTTEILMKCPESPGRCCPQGGTMEPCTHPTLFMLWASLAFHCQCPALILVFNMFISFFSSWQCKACYIIPFLFFKYYSWISWSTWWELNCDMWNFIFKYSISRHVEERSTTSRAPPGRWWGGTGWPRTRGSTSARPSSPAAPPMASRMCPRRVLPPAPRRRPWGATSTTTGTPWTPTPSTTRLLCATTLPTLPTELALILAQPSRPVHTQGMIPLWYCDIIEMSLHSERSKKK